MTMKTLVPQRSSKYLVVGIQQRPGASSPFWFWTLDRYHENAAVGKELEGKVTSLTLRCTSEQSLKNAAFFIFQFLYLEALN